MDLASRLLRSIRHTTAFSQRGLAHRARCRAATIADIERGAHDPTVGRLDHLLGLTGHRLVALPTRSRPVSEAAEAVTEWLTQRKEPHAFREVIQLSDDLARERGAVRVALTATPPRLIGDPKWDALIAGVTAFWLGVDGLTQPEWLSDPRRVSAEPWYVDVTTPREELEAETPPELARRRVFLAASELASV
jgi:transcriptional regulator with XRE-family HTH domain